MSRVRTPLRTTTGLGRAATAVKVATSAFSSTVNSVGDISAGSIVEVVIPAASNTPVETSIRARPTGVIIIDLDTDGADPPTGNNPGEYAWTTRTAQGDTTLYAWGHSTGPGATIKFWVF